MKNQFYNIYKHPYFFIEAHFSKRDVSLYLIRYSLQLVRGFQPISSTMTLESGFPVTYLYTRKPGVTSVTSVLLIYLSQHYRAGISLLSSAGLRATQFLNGIGCKFTFLMFSLFSASSERVEFSENRVAIPRTCNMRRRNRLPPAFLVPRNPLRTYNSYRSRRH